MKRVKFNTKAPNIKLKFSLRSRIDHRINQMKMKTLIPKINKVKSIHKKFKRKISIFIM